MADPGFANRGGGGRSSAEGTSVEASKEPRGGVWGGGIPLHNGGESFSILTLKVATFSAFLAVQRCHDVSDPLDLSCILGVSSQWEGQGNKRKQ